MSQMSLPFEAPQDIFLHRSDPSGNTKLVEFGIWEDVSGWRAHVSSSTVFVFRTTALKWLLQNRSYRSGIPAYQRGILTAKGILVPHKDIPRLIPTKISSTYMHRAKWPPKAGEPLDVTGRRAEWLYQAMVNEGAIRFYDPIEFEEQLREQIKGIDFTGYEPGKHQVKADLKADTTGNLYIQTHECNPHGLGHN